MEVKGYYHKTMTFYIIIIKLQSRTLLKQVKNISHILLCVIRSHIFVCMVHRVLHPWHVIIIPMYNVHPFFSLKNLGKRCALYMAKYSTSEVKKGNKSEEVYSFGLQLKWKEILNAFFMKATGNIGLATKFVQFFP